MFTWVCPKCKREVPPAYNECPDCAAEAAGGSPPAATAGAAPGQPEAASQPGYTPVREVPPSNQPNQPTSPMFQAPPPQAGPPQYYPPRPRAQMPTWLMALLFALLFVGLGGGIFWLVNHQHSQASAASAPTATVESPAAKPGLAQNPVQKFVEITGVRFEPSSKGLLVKFVVVNHSTSDLVGLNGNVTVWGSTQKAEEDAVGTFSFQTSMEAGASKELEMPFTTKLKLKEMPSWQNVTTDVQITAPATLPPAN